MALTEKEKAAKYDEIQAKTRDYYKRWKARQAILARKIAAAKITVSSAEVEAEMKK